jgi:hypothetical protein
MKKYAKYEGCDVNTNVVIWLFEILEEYDETMKANFL